MPELLPYRDGTRDCFPVKCALFFKQQDVGRPRVYVLFTDQENEKLILKEGQVEWVLDQPEEATAPITERFTQLMAELGYKVSSRQQGPDYLSFNLHPLEEK